MQMNHIMWRILFAVASIVLLSGTARADQLRFESREKRVAFIELFTSEGCSSCPQLSEHYQNSRRIRLCGKHLCQSRFM